MILLIGGEGSMGKRYQTILRHIGINYRAFDTKTSVESLEDFYKGTVFDGIILASPTDTHFNYLLSLAHLNLPIMCEKPISKSKSELDMIRDLFKHSKNGEQSFNLTMTMQYKVLDDPNSVGDSHYNYFRTGNDGLRWDCLQIIALARGNVSIGNTSPIWDCILNGKRLSIADMDRAYVEFVKGWLKSPGDDVEKLVEYHEKVMSGH